MLSPTNSQDLEGRKNRQRQDYSDFTPTWATKTLSQSYSPQTRSTKQKGYVRIQRWGTYFNSHHWERLSQDSRVCITQGDAVRHCLKISKVSTVSETSLAFKLCLWVFDFLCICGAHVCSVSIMSEEGTGSPGTGVTDRWLWDTLGFAHVGYSYLSFLVLSNKHLIIVCVLQLSNKEVNKISLSILYFVPSLGPFLSIGKQKDWSVQIVLHIS